MNNQLIKDYIDGASLEWSRKEVQHVWSPLKPYLDPKDLTVFCNNSLVFRKEYKDPYKIFKDALKEGKRVAYLGFSTTPEYTNDPDAFAWCCPPKDYAIEDPYADLKKAYAEGKQLEVYYQDRWNALTIVPYWSSPPEHYRIKPEQKILRTHLRTNVLIDTIAINDYSKEPNVELTFEDNILIKVEMIK